MAKITIQLEPLACPACAQKIQTALSKAPGVTSAKVLYNAGKAKVVYDETAITADALRAVVRTLGYEIIKISVE